jgi:enoyl-CoA hydratase/carnithine racemase
MVAPDRKDTPSMEFEQIRTALDDRVFTITLKRPERLNAWTATMGRELIAAFDRADADADDEVRVVVVTGARIGFVFARRGIVPEACSSWFLPRVVGIGRAMEWVATGRVFSAHEALEAGLVRTSFLEKRPAEFPDRVSDGLPDVFPWLQAPVFE